MTECPRQLLRDETAEYESFARPGSTAALVLSCLVWMLWWTVSAIIGPIRLAFRHHEAGAMDELGSQGGEP